MRGAALERDVQTAVVEFLQLDGWLALRTDPVSDRATVNAIRRAIAVVPLPPGVRAKIYGVIDKCVRGKGFGAAGMPDYQFRRYTAQVIHTQIGEPNSELIWIEFKRPGGVPTAEQTLWHQAEAARGGLVLVVDDIDGFINWYTKSQFYRRGNGV